MAICKNDISRCVVCDRRYTPDHRCPKSVMRLYEKAERMATQIADPAGPTLDELDGDQRIRRRMAKFGLVLEYP